MQSGAHFFKSSYKFDRTSGADVLDYNMSSGTQSQKAVSCYERFLCYGRRTVDAQLVRNRPVIDSVIFNEGGIFFMETDRDIQAVSFLHCLI